MHMKIAQYHEGNRVRLGLVEKDVLVPLDPNFSMMECIRGGRAIGQSGAKLPLAQVRLAPPIGQPGKILAMGLNYMDHVEESRGTVPKVPLVFAKFPSSVTGPRDPIVWKSAVTGKVDFEAELAVVIGREVSGVSEEEAREAVFGYMCANDVSARDLQFGDGQWVRGKSLDTFCPIGPWIVTPEEIPDPHDLAIRCLVNGVVMQESSTNRMIFRIPYLISFLSRHFTLFPGDLILTGTPHGVGAFRNPPVYLRDGDEVVVEIERIGRLANPCRVIES
jgi:2-keto-4-pentenoate hydratase/2-oxohepta-3-ene-1,7-dioic acid hydratase in catechol pathway